MSTRKCVATAAILATLAACGGRGGSEVTAPEGPAFDGGGVGFGSGHATEPDTTTQNATAQEGGGVGFGSGH